MAVRVRVGRVALMGLLVGGAAALFMSMNARAGVERTWDGGGTTGNWSEAANWAGDEVPQATDTLIFPAGLDAAERATTADLTAGFAELRFADTGYAVAGSTRIDPDRIAVSVAGAAVVIDAPVDVTGGLTIDLGAGGATVTLGGELSGNGNTTVLGTGDVLLSGGGNALGFASVADTSTASLRVTGSYPQLSIRLDGGEAVIDGAVFEVLADDNATRTSGTGTIVDRLSVDAGVLEPGVAQAVDATTLPVGGVLEFHSPGTYAPDLLADGTGDVLVTHKAIFLNDSPLAIDGPGGADAYTIIDNRDTQAVFGTFENSPEGSFISADGGALQYAISYQGGDGNDVVLSKVAESVWDGGGADTNWSTPANWVGDSAPSVADSIEFPAGPNKLATNNDLTGFRGGIVVTGQGYMFGGNDITPAGGLLVSGGSATVNLTVHGAGPVTATNNAALVLTAGNDYTGDTSVLEDSTLEIAGDQPNSHVIVDFSVLTVSGTTGWVDAAFSSYVFGTGTIDGELVVQHSGSRVSPGTGDGTIGTLTVAAIQLSDGPVMEFDGAGADVDRLVVTSTFGSLGDAPLRLAGTVTASPITLIDVIDSSGSLDGTFAGLPDGSPVDFGGAPYTISYDSGTDGNDVVLTKVVVDPTLPELSISDGSPSSVTEGDVGDSPVTVTFTVTRSGDTSGTSSVSVSAGSDDYTVLPAVVEFAAEATSKTITATVVTDNVDEADEDMVVSLASPVGATISDGTGVAKLIDDDTAGMSVTAPASPVSEGAAAVFTVSIDGARDHNVVVSVATGAAGDTATEGSDYPSLDGGSLTFLPSDTARTVTVATTDDGVDESGETVSVVVDGTIVATATIADNDEPPPPVVPSASIGDVSVGEGDGTAVLTVTLSGPTTAAVTVGYGTADGSARAGDDYTVTSGTLSFPPGTTTQTVSVAVAGDTVDEAAESFEVRLASPVGATIADGTGVATIVDDDASPKPAFPSATSRVNEAVGTATFTVTLPHASQQNLTFGWGTTAGTALAGSDFTDSSGSLTIPAGSTTGSFTVPITSDNEDEPDESFTLSVVAPTPLQPAGGRSVAVPAAVPDGEVLATAVVTIVDDYTAQRPPPSDPPASDPPASNPPASTTAESTPSVTTPRPTTSSTPVARTGSDTVTSTALALVLIAGGATLMVWRRRQLWPPQPRISRR